MFILFWQYLAVIIDMNNNLLIKQIKNIKGLNKRETKNYSIIFSDKTGIINAILKRNELKKYGLQMFQCLSAQTKILFDSDRNVSSGGLGIDFSTKNAFAACIGEAIERYCMSFVDGEDLLFEYWGKLPKSHRVNDFHLYTSRQYKITKDFLDPKLAKISWVKISNFFNHKKYIYWPASLIYLPFKYGKAVAETSSTGVSAHNDANKAIVGGLLELLERDALMINFLQQLKPPEININSIIGKNKKLIKKIKCGYNIRIYKLFSDIRIPIFLGFIWKKRGNKVHYGIGACAALSSEKAIEKILKECLFTYFYSKNILDLKQKNKNNINTLYEHFLFYQDKKFFKLLPNSKQQDYKVERCSINFLVDELKKNSLDVYFKELTTPDVKVAKIKVFKVIVPGLIDLNKSHLLKREGASRFWDVPRKLGLKVRKNLSNMPHPFP